MVKTRIEVFPDIKEQIDFFEERAGIRHRNVCTQEDEDKRRRILWQLLKEVLPVLEAQEDFDNDSLFAAFSVLSVKRTEYKTGFVMWPLRTAVSGKQMTPAGATEIMEITRQRRNHPANVSEAGYRN